MPQPMSLSDLSLFCPDSAKRIGQLIEHASEHFNEVLTFGDAIRKIAAGAASADSYSSFYLNSFVQTVRSKTLKLANLRYIKENCPDFFRLLPDLLQDRSTFSAFCATDDCDPVMMNLIELSPRDMEAAKEKMAMHAYLFEWLMRAHCAGRGLEPSSLAARAPVEEGESLTMREHEYSLSDMLDFFESRYESPTSRFMGRSGVGRWLQLRALNVQVQNIQVDPIPGAYISQEHDRKIAYQSMLGLNHLGEIDFQRWCASTDQEVALATEYFFSESVQTSVDRGGVKILSADIREMLMNTTYVMLLTGNNPVQVFSEIQRRCIAFSERFEDDPIGKHVLEDVFPKMLFYPFRFTWSSLGLTDEDFRGIKAHQVFESKAVYLGRFGGFGVMHMLSYSQQPTFLRSRPGAVASHEPEADAIEEELPRYKRDVEEFCSLVKTNSHHIHIKILHASVLAILSHEVIHTEVSRLLNLDPGENKLRTSQEDFLAHHNSVNLLLGRIPQAVFDTLVVEANQQGSQARLAQLLSLRSPSQHMIQSLPERHHATVLENDLGL
jgi:hypothetical protein